MDYCGCGSVSDLMKNLAKESKTLTDDQIVGIVIGVVNGLAYLHGRSTTFFAFFFKQHFLIFFFLQM
jgi:serine/threonine protein kinase